MSEEVQGNIPEANDGDAVERLQQPDADWLLQVIVHSVNTGDSPSFPVMLIVGGQLIAGTIVGGREYFEGIASAASEGYQGDDHAWSNALRRISSDLYGEDGIKPEVGKTAFIHLKDARIHGTNSTSFPGREYPGMWWRGRISAIDGFSIGEVV